MELLTKATVAFALLPIITSEHTAIAAPYPANVPLKASSQPTLVAQAIVPTSSTTVVSGQDSIDISGGTPAAGNLFHSFDQFNLSQGETANFITPPLTEAVIGQVISGTASTLDGLLKVSGSQADLYLINPTGLFFGPNARLDLGGSFIATTASHIGHGNQWFEVLSNPDYRTLVNTPSQFGFRHAGTLVNQGQLTVPNGESLSLIGPHISNNGILNAPGGAVSLIAPEPGQIIRLRQPSSLLSLDFPQNQAQLLPALITGGDINHSSELIVSESGNVALVNSDLAPESPSSLIKNSGDISTQGALGGAIALLGDSIQVVDGILNASGDSGGGSVRIGGDYQGHGTLHRSSETVIADKTRIIADAIHTGNGGQVIVWSDGTTAFDGTISAQTTTGNGGLVETSGLTQLTIGPHANVNTNSPQGSAGLWLLDPTDLTVVENEGLGSISTGANTSTHSSINASTVANALDQTNVTLQSTNSITVDSAIDASNNGNSGNLFIDTSVLTLNERITLKDVGQLSGTATTVNVGINGSVQNGVDAVASGGTVTLAATTYREGNSITLDHPLTLVGQRQDGTYISGDLDNNGLGDHQVLNIASSGDNINLTDLTIQDGLSALDGAGLSNRGNNVVIRDVRFTNNQVTGSSQDGGAIHNQGSLTLDNTAFDNNRTGSDGGAIDILRGSVVITDSVFTNNQAGAHGGAIDVDPNGSLRIFSSNFFSNAAGTNGGALFSEGEAIINTANFLGNTSNEQGGAVFLDGDGEIRSGSFFKNTAQGGGGLYNQGTLNLLTSIVSENQSTGFGTLDGGGGILNTSGGTLTIDASLISNNISATKGGGILNLADDGPTVVAIANSTISGNQAATLGGGIEVASINSLSELSQLDITNSTISGNQALTGGGIRTVGPTALTNVTITNNLAINSGGGISENRTTAATPFLENTIVANNGAAINPDVDGDFSDRGHNLIGIDQGSTGLNISTLIGTASNPLDPRLTAINNNVGDLPSHQLLSDSPAANAGNNAAATARDQHGQARIVGGTVDLGAVESDSLPAVPSTPNPTIRSIPDHLSQSSNPPPSDLRQTSGNSVSSNTVSLNAPQIVPQEEKTAQPLSLEAEQTKLTRLNGQLHYFDEEAFQYLEENFSQDFEDYWQLPQTQPMTLQAVQKTLQQANETHSTQSAVVYAVYVPPVPTAKTTIDGFILPRTHNNPSPDDQLLLIMVSATGKPVQYLVNVSRAELTQQATLFRLAVSDPDDPLSYKALAQQMYNWLLAPLQPELEQHSIDHIMFSLDQGLRTIPLAAMMQGDSFVVEQYGLSIIPSVGLSQPQLGHVPPVHHALIAGANQFTEFDELPAVPTELDIVAQNTQAINVLLNETFTLDNFLELQQSQQPNLLHLATHAEFNAGDLDQSFIQFWNSKLTFNQMKELSWPALELLILSACGTALSSAEAELGFTGLAAAAGIETTMGSLWNVSDVGTLALMAEFYSQLSQSPLRFQSLQQAQLSLIHGSTHIKNNILNTSQDNIELPTEWPLPTAAEFSHPFYWAGFTMVGNPWH
ncbi:MAG: CHAT domain-containing protein [Cyanobacteria bacterium P01_A01_bin.137]